MLSQIKMNEEKKLVILESEPHEKYQIRYNSTSSVWKCLQFDFNLHPKTALSGMWGGVFFCFHFICDAHILIIILINVGY